MVKHYNGDETNRAIRNVLHIYFTNEIKMLKDLNPGLRIPKYSFDFFYLQDCDKLKTDNHFLTGKDFFPLYPLYLQLILSFGNKYLIPLVDLVAVIEHVQPRASYIKDGLDKSHTLTITDGRYVSFFDSVPI